MESSKHDRRALEKMQFLSMEQTIYYSGHTLEEVAELINTGCIRSVLDGKMIDRKSLDDYMLEGIQAYPAKYSFVMTQRKEQQQLEAQARNQKAWKEELQEIEEELSSLV